MIYLDHAATTSLDPAVLDAMLPHMRESWGNPSSVHAMGREARAAIDGARRTVAELLDVAPHEVIFTASGSEGNSLALFGRAEEWIREKEAPGHIVTLSIEHECSLKATAKLKRWGWQISELPVDEDGLLDIEDLAQALRDDTALVSIQWANNEVGTIQPIDDIALLCGERGIPFHCDAVQPIGQLPIPPLPDLTTIAAHKFHGPKGIGALIVRDHVHLAAQVMGGGQEFGLRAGTENTPGIVGLAKALELAIERTEEDAERLTELRDSFIRDVLTMDRASLNGHHKKRLPNNANFRFEGMSGEIVVIRLDMQGICAATGSACATGSSEPSHVLQAMGRNSKAATENVRFSLGRETTKEELEKTVHVLKEILL